MRMRYSTKVLSYEHAYGFILNTIETKRVEILGLKDWQGMLNELIYNEGISWLSRPLLNSLYGSYKKIEAFSQLFLTGYFKGELFGREFEKVKEVVLNMLTIWTRGDRFFIFNRLARKTRAKVDQDIGT